VVYVEGEKNVLSQLAGCEGIGGRRKAFGASDRGLEVVKKKSVASGAGNESERLAKDDDD
jgi:hypothetical protein